MSTGWRVTGWSGMSLRGISLGGGRALGPQLQAYLAELRLVDRGRGAGQGVGARGGLREGDHVADRVGARQSLDDPVEAVGDASVRRGAVAQCLEQEAEARLRLFGV